MKRKNEKGRERCERGGEVGVVLFVGCEEVVRFMRGFVRSEEVGEE